SPPPPAEMYSPSQTKSRLSSQFHLPTSFVILSEVIVSRSEAITQSKDPYPHSPLNCRRKALLRAPKSPLKPACRSPTPASKILRRHPLPQRPVMLRIVPVNIQPV